MKLQRPQVGAVAPRVILLLVLLASLGLRAQNVTQPGARAARSAAIGFLTLDPVQGQAGSTVSVSVQIYSVSTLSGTRETLYFSGDGGPDSTTVLGTFPNVQCTSEGAVGFGAACTGTPVYITIPTTALLGQDTIYSTIPGNGPGHFYATFTVVGLDTATPTDTGTPTDTATPLDSLTPTSTPTSSPSATPLPLVAPSGTPTLTPAPSATLPSQSTASSTSTAAPTSTLVPPSTSMPSPMQTGSNVTQPFKGYPAQGPLSVASGAAVGSLAGMSGQASLDALAATLNSQELYSAEWDGAGWSSPTRITTNTVSDSEPALAARPGSGNAVLVWTHSITTSEYTQ